MARTTRRFIDTREGQLHCREAGQGEPVRSGGPAHPALFEYELLAVPQQLREPGRAAEYAAVLRTFFELPG